MKKVFLVVVLFVMVRLGMAAVPPDVILERFSRSFPNASEVKWYEEENGFRVYFKSEKTMVRIWYDREGEVIKSLRHYDKEGLPVFIAAKLEKKFPGRDIKSVTELTTAGGVKFQIILEDDKRYYVVEVDGNGSMWLDKKFIKADKATVN